MEPQRQSSENHMTNAAFGVAEWGVHHTNVQSNIEFSTHPHLQQGPRPNDHPQSKECHADAWVGASAGEAAKSGWFCSPDTPPLQFLGIPNLEGSEVFHEVFQEFGLYALYAQSTYSDVETWRFFSWKDVSETSKMGRFESFYFPTVTTAPHVTILQGFFLLKNKTPMLGITKVPSKFRMLCGCPSDRPALAGAVDKSHLLGELLPPKREALHQHKTSRNISGQKSWEIFSPVPTVPVWSRATIWIENHPQGSGLVVELII